MVTPYRGLPSVDRVLSYPEVGLLARTYSRESVVDLIRQKLEEARDSISNGTKTPTLDDLADAVLSHAQRLWQSGPRPVINATGVIIHTNLGRSPLSLDALEAILKGARGYSNLEFEVEEGERGSRQAHVEHLLKQLIGAEASLMVNNNASAVLLALSTLAQGREVIVSRGEAVEIGGGFRIPDVLRQSGAVLVEVGTTNRTYASDYERAITPNTAALLKVHPSNFRITGFTETPSLQELVELGRSRGIPVLHDLGSGCLIDTAQFGLAHEPMPQESVSAGADLTFFSGDKLLGGPQAGIVVGQEELVSKLAKHPMARALRIDKLSLLALSATLLHYLKGEARAKIPIWRMIATSLDDLEKKAHKWKEQIGVKATVQKDESTIGGGSLPGETLPTWVISLNAESVAGGAKEVARRLRASAPAVIARIAEEQVLLDPRTVLPEDEPPLIHAVKRTLR